MKCNLDNIYRIQCDKKHFMFFDWV